MEKLQNQYFLILWFCFYEATLEVDFERQACAMNMVDSAFERVNVAHSHINNEFVLWHLLVSKNKNEKGPVFENFFFFLKKKNFVQPKVASCKQI